MIKSKVVIAVDCLQLRFEGAAGSEHRLRPITRYALELLHQCLRDEPLAGLAEPLGERLPSLRLPPFALDLRHTPDEAVARRLAEALFGALKAAVAAPASTGHAPVPLPMGRRAGR